MAITVTHPKVSAIPDDPASVAAGEVVPSDWNANHTVVVDGLDNVPIGAGGASTGAFTTLSASSTVSGTGFSTYLASPPAIGGSAPAAGNFTTLDATTLEVTNLRAKDGTSAGSIADTTGIVTLASSVLTTTDINGGTIDGASIGASSASSGAFTTLSASSTVSGTGFSTYLASPPAIGGTTPAAGSFTNLNATGVAVFNGAIGSAIAGSEVSIIGTAPTDGGTNAFAIQITTVAPSNVTNQYFGIRSLPGTAAASFTVGTLACYSAGNGTVGASSAITNLHGYFTQTGLTTGTNNYGFYGNIAASGSSRWNFYANGTAPNYFAGPLGIGATTTGDPLRIAGTINHSAFSNAQIIDATIGSSVTSGFRGVMSRPITQNATFTLSSLIHFYANPQAKGASSTITNQYGFFAEGSITDATNNFGFYSNIAAASGRWNFYAAGTASNYFNGNVGIGTNTFGTSATNTLAILTGTAPTTGPADTIQLYSTDLSAGNTIPSFYTEGTNVGTGTPTANRTIAVRFNGTVYYLLASTIP